MPEPPANSVEGTPSTVWPGVLFSFLFCVELRALLPHCPLLSSFSWGAAPAPRGKKGMGPSCLLISVLGQSSISTPMLSALCSGLLNLPQAGVPSPVVALPNKECPKFRLLRPALGARAGLLQ